MQKLFITSIFIIAIVTFVACFASAPVYAVNRESTHGGSLRGQIQTTRAQLQDERKDQIKNLQEQFKDKISSKVGEIKKLIGLRAFIDKAKVTAKGTTSLTVTDKDNRSIMVNITANTKIERRFYGKSTLDEILVGHEVNISGKWTDDSHTTVDAAMIRDLSIQKRFGVFIGTVSAISGNDITLNTVNRGTQKVTISASTKITDRKGAVLLQSGILVGHRIRVKGLWDRTNNTVTDVTQLKDYNVPPKPTVAVTPSLVVSATPTPVVISASPTATPIPTPTPV
jgi:hypothetical protein